MKLSICIIIAGFLFLHSCRSKSEEIIRLLNSSDKNDVILGAYKAGESKDNKYVPFLLYNADDIRTSVNLKFKGFSVYQEKMIALKKIFKQAPPRKITNTPDSIIIKFYTDLYKRI